MSKRNRVRTILSTSANETGAAYYVGNKDQGSVYIDITGTITVAVQTSIDGSTWEAIQTGGASSWTADKDLAIDMYGKNFVRAVTTGVGGGSAVVQLSA